jgi:hypothetical protein
MGKINFEATLKSKKEEEMETKDKHETKGTMVFETGIDEKITITCDPGVLVGFKVGTKYTWTIDNPQQTIPEATAKAETKVDTIEKANKVAEKIANEIKAKDPADAGLPKPNLPRISDKKRELAAKKNEEETLKDKKKSKGSMNYLVT